MGEREKSAAGGAIAAGLISGWLTFAVTKSTTAFWIVALVAAFAWWIVSSTEASSSPPVESRSIGSDFVEPSPKNETSGVSCPCGCGQSVRLREQGLVGRYQSLVKFQPIFAHAVSLAEPHVDRPTIQSMAQTLEHGEQLRMMVLMHLHRVATPGNALNMYDIVKLHEEYMKWGTELMAALQIQPPAN
jgi:hypothetical protein